MAIHNQRKMGYNQSTSQLATSLHFYTLTCASSPSLYDVIERLVTRSASWHYDVKSVSEPEVMMVEAAEIIAPNTEASVRWGDEYIALRHCRFFLLMCIGL